LSQRLGARELRVSSDLAKVSLVGIGLRSDPGIAARLCRGLNRQGIPVSGLVVNELRVSCLLESGQADDAIRLLHDTFELAGESSAEALSASAPA
ncbi:MAG TPA: ACT domain-containing protein, partial [Cystobacter sp.]